MWVTNCQLIDFFIPSAECCRRSWSPENTNKVSKYFNIFTNTWFWFLLFSKNLVSIGSVLVKCLIHCINGQDGKFTIYRGLWQSLLDPIVNYFYSITTCKRVVVIEPLWYLLYCHLTFYFFFSPANFSRITKSIEKVVCRFFAKIPDSFGGYL